MKHMKSLSLTALLFSLAALSLSPLAFSQSQGISGEACYARITRSKQALTVNPNQVGNFPTIDVRPLTSIKLQVIYPNGQATEKVTVSALEGGNFGNSLSTQDLILDSLKTATFYFATGGGRGLYRVSVRKGADEKILEFWVGDKMTKATE